MVFFRFVQQMWERLQRFRRLSGHSRAMFLRAAILLPVISLSLRFRGFRATQDWLRRFLPAKSLPEVQETMEEAGIVERAVRAAARHGLGHPTCLEQSLALWWLLEREGAPSALRIGVRKIGERFEAHAWVECQGLPLGEPDALHEHYAAFDAELSSRTVGQGL